MGCTVNTFPWNVTSRSPVSNSDLKLVSLKSVHTKAALTKTSYLVGKGAGGAIVVDTDLEFGAMAPEFEVIGIRRNTCP